MPTATAVFIHRGLPRGEEARATALCVHGTARERVADGERVGLLPGAVLERLVLLGDGVRQVEVQQAAEDGEHDEPDEHLDHLAVLPSRKRARLGVLQLRLPYLRVEAPRLPPVVRRRRLDCSGLPHGARRVKR
eukprot:CAMPEP_0184394070 /NCGR_PEP_ID=MMETSP0007-20130409/38346_1 /TAXON_ID=97485 /ORGANISM="Prymnesium parvum, Strain Texoma1" /LENGTH=133 /DNA_ID=CAMNT_0026745449 /DNA_START=254 /DNA_END=651 /DNA_ORIENTATION=+